MQKLTLLFAALILASTTLLAQTQTVSYNYPVYNTPDDPTSGIKEWKTGEVEANIVTSSSEQVTWGTEGQTSWYIVTGEDVQLSKGAVCNSAVNLILADGATLTANGEQNQAGIEVSGEGNYLTIYGQTAQSGQLKTTGGKWAAGIGGGNQGSCYNIAIYGGIVTATGGIGGAGIGGGNQGSCYNIAIYGGTVTATGVDGGAGIGGGADMGGADISEKHLRCGIDITINGGNVTATGGTGAAGIGGGVFGIGSIITINGGTVTAKGGGSGGAGIGGGKECDGSDITINGGIVTATGSNGGAGIGGGVNGAGKDITINGGIVTATGGIGGAGIGGGGEAMCSGIYIYGGSVTAKGGNAGVSGIGGGVDGESNGIHVSISHIVRAGESENPTTEIATDRTDRTNISSLLLGIQYVTIVPAPTTKITLTAEDFTVTLPEDLDYDGNEKKVKVEIRADYEMPGASDITIYYNNDKQVKPINSGTYQVYIDIRETYIYAAVTGITSEAWNFTIIDPLLRIKVDAIAEIEDAIEDITNEDIIAIATTAKTNINAATTEADINAIKEKALADLAYALGFYNSGKAAAKAEAATELLGEMATPCYGCHAVEITDEENTTVTLYNPMSVKFIKTESAMND